MACIENLIPFNQLDPARLREITRMGGIASGAARRRKAEAKRQIRALLILEALKSEVAEELTEELLRLKTQSNRRGKRGGR